MRGSANPSSGSGPLVRLDHLYSDMASRSLNRWQMRPLPTLLAVLILSCGIYASFDSPFPPLYRPVHLLSGSGTRPEARGQVEGEISASRQVRAQNPRLKDEAVALDHEPRTMGRAMEDQLRLERLRSAVASPISTVPGRRRPDSQTRSRSPGSAAGSTHDGSGKSSSWHSSEINRFLATQPGPNTSARSDSEGRLSAVRMTDRTSSMPCVTRLEEEHPEANQCVSPSPSTAQRQHGTITRWHLPATNTYRYTRADYRLPVQRGNRGLCQRQHDLCVIHRGPEGRPCACPAKGQCGPRKDSTCSCPGPGMFGSLHS